MEPVFPDRPRLEAVAIANPKPQGSNQFHATIIPDETETSLKRMCLEFQTKFRLQA
jgi:hypothetical protein